MTSEHVDDPEPTAFTARLLLSCDHPPYRDNARLLRLVYSVFKLIHIIRPPIDQLCKVQPHTPPHILRKSTMIVSFPSSQIAIHSTQAGRAIVLEQLRLDRETHTELATLGAITNVLRHNVEGYAHVPDAQLPHDTSGAA